MITSFERVSSLPVADGVADDLDLQPSAVSFFSAFHYCGLV